VLFLGVSSYLYTKDTAQIMSDYCTKILAGDYAQTKKMSAFYESRQKVLSLYTYKERINNISRVINRANYLLAENKYEELKLCTIEISKMINIIYADEKLTYENIF
ncbi:MAG: hypothetical protein RSE93_06255, partial [Oscillospiraceae bacterium]